MHFIKNLLHSILKRNKTKETLRNYLYGKPTEEEREVVDDWYESLNPGKDCEIENLSETKERIFERILSRINTRQVRPFYLQTRFQIAATMLLILLSTLFYYLSINKADVQQTAMTLHPRLEKQDVLAPSSTKALLTLSDGSTIELDSAGIGSLATEMGSDISKVSEGEIAYAENTEHAAKTEWNTLAVPKGSKPLQIVLSDGSKVWVNVGSSLTYPVRFSDAERRIHLTGEAFFDVAHRISKNTKKVIPFIVNTERQGVSGKDVEIRVLGTSFNVNAYENEKALRVTLLEGEVKVQPPGGESIKMEEGEEAALDHTGVISLKKEADLEEAVAWKTAWFYFNSLTVPEIMRQIERWYNVVVHYQNEVTEKRFSGIVSRKNNVSEVLKIMEQAGIRFIIQGRTITVL